MKKLIVALVAVLTLPLGAAAQGGSGPGPGDQGMGPGMGRGPGMGMRDPKRHKLALMLGLAEALDLDEAQALKLRDTVDRFALKRQPLMQQQRDAILVLRAAAAAEKTEATTVDQAIARLHDARSQIMNLDREFFTTVTQGLSPQKKARAVLFFGKFHERMGPHGGAGGRLPPRGGGHRMGPGMMGPGAGGPGWMERQPPAESGGDLGMLEEPQEDDEP